MDQNCATLEHTHILIILNNHMLHRHLNDLKICYNSALLYIYNDQVLVLAVSRFFMEQPFCLAINSKTSPFGIGNWSICKNPVLRNMHLQIC